MKILIVQNKKGIGDLVIYLPYIEAIAKKFATKIYLLTKENSKATKTPYIAPESPTITLLNPLMAAM